MIWARMKNGGHVVINPAAVQYVWEAVPGKGEEGLPPLAGVQFGPDTEYSRGYIVVEAATLPPEMVPWLHPAPVRVLTTRTHMTEQEFRERMDQINPPFRDGVIALIREAGLEFAEEEAAQRPAPTPDALTEARRLFTEWQKGPVLMDTFTFADRMQRILGTESPWEEEAAP